MCLPPASAAFLYDQSHIFHPLTVFCAGGDDIDAGRIDAAVPENIRKLGDVLFDAVEYPGEQVPQVMGEHLLRIDVRLGA